MYAARAQRGSPPYIVILKRARTHPEQDQDVRRARSERPTAVHRDLDAQAPPAVENAQLWRIASPLRDTIHHSPGAVGALAAQRSRERMWTFCSRPTATRFANIDDP